MKPTYRDVLIAVLRLQSELDRRAEAFFHPIGITTAQFNVLNLLSVDGEMGQSELTSQLLVGKATVSVVINRMVRDGFVTRRQHEKDRRHVILTLTPKGRALWKKIYPEYDEGIQQIFGAVPISHREQFIQDIHAIFTALQPNSGKRS